MIGYILWLVKRSDADRKPMRFYASTSIPALGLILISILSVFQAQDTQLSLFKIAQLVELFLIYFYLANHLRTKQEMQFFVTVFMGGMLAESILMIVQWRTGLSFSLPGLYASVSEGRAGRDAGYGRCSRRNPCCVFSHCLCDDLAFPQAVAKGICRGLFPGGVHCFNQHWRARGVGQFYRGDFGFHVRWVAAWLGARPIVGSLIINNAGHWRNLLPADL